MYTWHIYTYIQSHLNNLKCSYIHHGVSETWSASWAYVSVAKRLKIIIDWSSYFNNSWKSSMKARKKMSQNKTIEPFNLPSWAHLLLYLNNPKIKFTIIYLWPFAFYHYRYDPVKLCLFILSTCVSILFFMPHNFLKLIWIKNSKR